MSECEYCCDDTGCCCSDYAPNPYENDLHLPEMEVGMKIDLEGPITANLCHGVITEIQDWGCRVLLDGTDFVVPVFSGEIIRWGHD